MALTWDEMLAYTPQRLGGEVAVEMPWIQVSLPESVIISSVCVLFFGIQLTGPCSVKTYWRLWFGFCFDLISSKVVTWNDWPEGTSVEPSSSAGYGPQDLALCRRGALLFKGWAVAASSVAAAAAAAGDSGDGGDNGLLSSGAAAAAAAFPRAVLTARRMTTTTASVGVVNQSAVDAAVGLLLQTTTTTVGGSETTTVVGSRVEEAYAAVVAAIDEASAAGDDNDDVDDGSGGFCFSGDSTVEVRGRTAGAVGAAAGGDSSRHTSQQLFSDSNGGESMSTTIKALKDVKVGDEIRAVDSSSQQLTWKKVAALPRTKTTTAAAAAGSTLPSAKSKSQEDFFAITTASSTSHHLHQQQQQQQQQQQLRHHHHHLLHQRRLEATPHHSFKVLTSCDPSTSSSSSSLSLEGAVKDVSAQELKVGDCLWTGEHVVTQGSGGPTPAITVQAAAAAAQAQAQAVGAPPPSPPSSAVVASSSISAASFVVVSDVKRRVAVPGDLTYTLVMEGYTALVEVGGVVTMARPTSAAVVGAAAAAVRNAEHRQPYRQQHEKHQQEHEHTLKGPKASATVVANLARSQAAAKEHLLLRANLRERRGDGGGGLGD
jgi:hypothetical protein